MIQFFICYLFITGCSIELFELKFITLISNCVSFKLVFLSDNLTEIIYKVESILLGTEILELKVFLILVMYLKIKSIVKLAHNNINTSHTNQNVVKEHI